MWRVDPGDVDVIIGPSAAQVVGPAPHFFFGSSTRQETKL